MKLLKPLSFLWLVCGLAATLPTTQSHAQDAEKIVRAMSDYLASAKTMSLTYDTDIEVITPDIQKLQFASSGQVLLSRPNQLRATRIGGYANVELVFDGNTLTMFGKNIDAVAQVQAKGSVDQLVQRLRDEFSVALPGADFLLSDSYDELMIGVRDLKHIGRGVIDGVECEHLAFRTEDADWQLWVEVGAKPIPRKYVITSKGVAAAPQYTLRIKEFRTNADLGADAFAFKAPASAKKVDITALSVLDEVPQGLILGDKK
jgi:hypothetical protein